MLDLLNHAKENGYAIPAVNCVSSSGINACLEAARKNDSPVIIQFSAGGSQVSYHSKEYTINFMARPNLIFCSSTEGKALTTRTTPPP